MKNKLCEDITKNAIILTVCALLIKVFGVVYKVPLSYMLGDEGMGYFNSAYTVFGTVYLICTAGVPRAISILVCKANAESDYEGRERVLRCGMGLFLSLGVVFSMLLFIFAERL